MLDTGGDRRQPAEFVDTGRRLAGNSHRSEGVTTMTRISIRHIPVVRAANIAAALYAVGVIVFSLVIAIPFALFAAAAGSQATGTQVGPIVAGGAIGILVFALVGAVFYAIFGWIITAIAVALFNFVADRLGGLQTDVVFETPLPGGPGMSYAYPGYPAASPTPAAYQPGQTAPPSYQPGQTAPPAAPGGTTQPPMPPGGWGPPQS